MNASIDFFITHCFKIKELLVLLLKLYLHIFHKNEIYGFAQSRNTGNNFIKLRNCDELAHMILHAGKNKADISFPAKTVTNKNGAEAGRVAIHYAAHVNDHRFIILRVEE